MKAFRAKSKVVDQIRGDHTKQCANLRDYVLELKANNPNTNVKIKCEHPDDPEDTHRVFQRIYICIGALKEGFKAGKRDLLGFDGTFMKGPFPGQLLTAVSLDPNNGIYPLAYCIAEAENKESWTWFLEQLGEDLDLQRDSHFTFISDRQKVISLPLLNNFICLYNMYTYTLAL